MGSVLLDTTVVVDYLRGREGVRSRLRRLRVQGDGAFVSAVTVEEVSRGIRPHEEDEFIALLGGLDLAPLGIPEGRLAGFWRGSHEKRGRTLSQADALIAAAAVGIGALLATGNPKDFPMRGVEVEHWPAGE